MRWRALFPMLVCVLLAGCLAIGIRTMAQAAGAASVKPIEARSDR